MSSRFPFAAALLVSGSGCSGLIPCQTDDLSFRGTPTSASIAVGEKFTASAEFLGCGGRTSLPDEVRWSSQDTAVVRIVATTGEATAVAPGKTTVTATGTKYHTGPIIAVTVRP